MGGVSPIGLDAPAYWSGLAGSMPSERQLPENEIPLAAKASNDAPTHQSSGASGRPSFYQPDTMGTNSRRRNVFVRSWPAVSSRIQIKSAPMNKAVKAISSRDARRVP